MNTAPRILMISQYGADLARGSAYSGALERQKDYAESTRSYVAIVPGSSGAQEYRSGTLHVIPTGSMSVLGFMREAYDRAVREHMDDPFDMLMVDNPHAMGILGLMLRTKLSIPLVVHQMADMGWNHWYDRERRMNRVKQFITRFALRRADMIRVSTHAEVERLIDAGISRDQIALVPFYIDHDAFADALRNTQVTREPNRILYVGRLGPQKDVATLVRAVAHAVRSMPELRVTIVGDGPERSALERLARDLGLAGVIEFTGAIPRDRVTREFVRASIFALPSLYEGTCMVLHEAALAGLPIVSTMNAGARDFVRPDIDGELVRVRDHRSLGDALVRVAREQDTWQRMSRSVYDRARTATRTRALAAWDDLIHRTLAQAQV